MARKKGLAEIKALSSKSKQTKHKYANTKVWEAWEETRNPKGWELIAKGSLEECFELLDNTINCQIDEEFLVGDEAVDIDELEEKYGHLPDGVLHELQKKSKPYLDAFKTQCLEKGECQGWNWLIAASPSKFRQQQMQGRPFAYSDSWEVQEDSEGDLFFEGTLEECFEAISTNVSMEVHQEAGRFVHDGEDFSIEGHFERMGKMRDQKFETIKKECLSKGEYQGNGWQIRSLRTRQDCEWLKQNGYPYFG